MIKLEQKTIVKDCAYCNDWHTYTKDECFDKLWVMPEILYISSTVGEWTHPHSDYFLANPHYPLSGEENDDGTINYSNVTGNILRYINWWQNVEGIGEEHCLSMVMLIPEKEHWDKLQFEQVSEKLLNQKAVYDKVFEFFLATINHFLHKDGEYDLGTQLFQDSDYGKRFGKIYDFYEMGCRQHYVSPDVCLHYNINTRLFEGYST